MNQSDTQDTSTTPEQDLGMARLETELAGCRTQIPTVMYVDIPDSDPAVSIEYLQKPESRCKLCNLSQELRDGAEMAYIQGQMVYAEAHKWLLNRGVKIGFDSVSNHLKKHCEFNSPVIDLGKKLEVRQKDLQRIEGDPVNWMQQVVSDMILDCSQVDRSDDPDSWLAVATLQNKLLQTKISLMKTQHEIYGAEEQARAKVDENNEQIIAFLMELIGVVPAEHKSKIVELTKEFQIGGKV